MIATGSRSSWNISYKSEEERNHLFEIRGNTILLWEEKPIAMSWLPLGVLRISSEGDDRRIFLGSRFSIPAFFGVGKFGKYFFGGLKPMWRVVVEPAYLGRVVLRIKFNRTCFAAVLLLPPHFAQNGKSQEVTLVLRSYIKKSTYTVEIYSQYTRKNLDLLEQGPWGISR